MKPTTIRLRGIPQDVHQRLKARAALAGKSISEYILAELRKSVAQPTREELLERLRQLPPIELSRPAAEILREEREGR